MRYTSTAQSERRQNGWNRIRAEKGLPPISDEDRRRRRLRNKRYQDKKRREAAEAKKGAQK